MSNYTENAEKRELNREYAEKNLSYDRLVDYYCDYQQLKEDTEFYKENKKHLKLSIFFTFVSAYIASCFLIHILNDEITVLGLYFQSLLMATISFIISAILKLPLASSKDFFGKENVTIIVYVFLLILIPILVRFIL